MNRPSGTLLQRSAPAALALLLLAGCDVEWGGISVELREPAVEMPDTAGAASDTAAETPPLAMPVGPVLFHVRRIDAVGSAVIEPVAELLSGDLRQVGPRRAERADEFVSEFLARYYQADQPYTLFRGPARVGTFYVGAPAVDGSGLCLELRAEGRVELRPLADTLSEFLAWTPGARSGIDSLASPAYRSDMLSLSQVLARRGVQEHGIAGTWRIQPPADLRAVRVGTGARGFAATFMISDSLGPGEPRDSAGTVFLVTDYAPARGYFTVYFDADWYGRGQKRALRWLDAVDLVGGAADEWLLQASGDATSWYELVGQRDTAHAVVWSSRRPVCEAM